MRTGILVFARRMHVGMSCVPVLHFKYSRCLFTVRVSMSACVRVSTRCLGARGAGGALQGGLGEASGEGSDAGICQRRGREQLVPAADCGREVQVLQEDLGHSHEALVVHTPVIPPHDYLRRGLKEPSLFAFWFHVGLLGAQQINHSQCIAYLEDFALRALIEQESLLVGGIQIPLDNFGFLFGQTYAVLQYIHLHISCYRDK